MIKAAANPDNPRLGQDIFEARLTDTLLARGLVATEGIQEALRQQVLLGGHLATNLWELRLVDGKELTQLSAELLNIAIADPKDVSHAASEVRRLFARELIEQLRVLPIRVVGSVLQVATAEPWDLLTLGRAAYHCGYPVEPFFLAEVPLIALMEKVYGIPATARFWFGVQTNELRAQRQATSEGALEGADVSRRSVLLSYVAAEVAKLRESRKRYSTKTPPAQPEAPDDSVDHPGGSSRGEADRRRGERAQPSTPQSYLEDTARTAVASTLAAGRYATPQQINPGDPRCEPAAAPAVEDRSLWPSDVGIAPEAAIDAAAAAASAARLAPRAATSSSAATPKDSERLIIAPLASSLAAAIELPPAPILTLDEATAALKIAQDRDEVGGVLLRFALSKSRRAIVFVRRALLWAGWLGAGEGVDVPHLPSLLMPTAPGTIFGLVADTGAHYIGPLTQHPCYAPFLAALGGGRPRTAALFPVHFHGRLVFGLYLDGGPHKRVTTDVGDLLVLAQRVPAAIERLIRHRTCEHIARAPR